MTFRIDDDQLDPDVFIKQALEAKLSHISRRIDELMAAGRTGKQLESYLAARSIFSEVLRSPRLHLAKAATPAAGTGASALAAAAAQTRPATPGGARPSVLPLGAIPAPRRVSAAAAAAAFPTPGAAPAPAAAAAPVPAPAAAPVPVKKGMLGFLQNVQATSPPLSSSATPAAPAPAAAPPPAEAETPPPAAVVLPAVVPEAVAKPHPVTPMPSGGAKATDGGMKAFLQKMQKGLAAPAEEPPAAADGPLPAAERQKILDSLKKESAERGFADIYAMLQFKKKKLQESRKTLMHNPDEKMARVVAVIDREIAVVDELLKEKPPEIARRMGEYKEVAAVNKQRAALEQELGGLLDELKG